MGVALSCTLYNHFFVKGTAPAKKKPICAKLKINTKADLGYACLLKKKIGRNRGFSNITHIIVAMYFEGLIVYRNTRRPCYVSKRAYSCRVGEF